MKRFAMVCMLVLFAGSAFSQIKLMSDFNLSYKMSKRPLIDSLYYSGIDTVAYAGRDTISTKSAYLVGFVITRITSVDTVRAFNGRDTVFQVALATTDMGRGYNFPAVFDTNLVFTKNTDAALRIIWRKHP